MKPALHHPQEGVADEGVGADSGRWEGRQRPHRTLRVGLTHGERGAEVGVSDDADLAEPVDERAGLPGRGHGRRRLAAGGVRRAPHCRAHLLPGRAQRLVDEPESG
nr:hypothetical protein [Mycolicibacterium sp. TUM20983]